MAPMKYRIEPNPMTTPGSYKLRFIPQGVNGYDEVAKAVALKNPNWPADMVKAILKAGNEEIQDMNTNGFQVTYEDAFTFRPSFHARLDTPEDPLPPMEDLLRIKVSASRNFVKAIQQNAHLERAEPKQKAPVMLSAEDTNLELNDVLNPDGVLRLNGTNLLFDRKDQDCGCLIEGTRSGEAVQSQYAAISNTEVLLVPHIPAQDDPWNNEYTLSLSTRYTEHGSIRTGTYDNRLRSPLTLSGFGANNPQEVGILTGNAPAPYVTATSAEMTADERIRIQAILNLTDNRLTLSLQAMEKRGTAGDAVTVPGNGTYTLPGFSGSAITELTVRVDNYDDLVSLIRSSYNGRMVDILVMGM
ncbi:MAG: hypothetical protein D3908_05545 [Candidatus Electrothrix sp. AUS4]|nr:hypothetical protein [Candidatus Electrothrix sp. AUS4]